MNSRSRRKPSEIPSWEWKSKGLEIKYHKNFWEIPETDEQSFELKQAPTRPKHFDSDPRIVFHLPERISWRSHGSKLKVYYKLWDGNIERHKANSGEWITHFSICLFGRQTNKFRNLWDQLEVIWMRFQKVKKCPRVSKRMEWCVASRKVNPPTDKILEVLSLGWKMSSDGFFFPERFLFSFAGGILRIWEYFFENKNWLIKSN